MFLNLKKEKISFFFFCFIRNIFFNKRQGASLKINDLCLSIWKVSITKPISWAGISMFLPAPLLSFSSPFFSSTGTLPSRRCIYNHDDNYIVVITLIILMLISEIVHFKQSNKKVARIAVSGLPRYCTIFHFPSVKGVTSQLFLIICCCKPYIFWINIF